MEKSIEVIEARETKISKANENVTLNPEIATNAEHLFDKNRTIVVQSDLYVNIR